MSNSNNTVNILAAAFLAAGLSVTSPVWASETGAFIGGVFATKLLGTLRERTRAEEVQAYNSERPVQVQHVVHTQAAPAAAGMTPEQKLNQLDKLAAGGYITPAEYKARRKAILDSM
jgi:hypothetical protein